VQKVQSPNGSIAELEEKIKELGRSRDFYKSRIEKLQAVQHKMRDPERTLVCDIIANNALLPDLNGLRYALRPPIENMLAIEELDDIMSDKES